ncbi:MAG: putative lipid II flippase FtsW [Planctomycetota bacterium]|nr:putative lipid II flippase FtsW [Planctomycetota bacterium]
MELHRHLFISLACVLLGFGILMVHSASITSWPTEFERVYLSRHLIFVALGLSAAFIASKMPARFWYHAAPHLFALTLVLLIIVLIPGIGTEVKGARRWLRFGGYSLQPSELAKITLVLFLCRMVVDRQDVLHRWFSGTIPLLIPIAVVFPLVLRQPDLGTSLFLAVGCGLVLFFGGWPIRNFVVAGVLAVPAAVGMLALKPYQLERITGFLATWTDVGTAPYQLKQSLVSMGVGGISGNGLGMGWQKLSFLPEANTDFVFAVVGEELGLIGTVSLVLIWSGLFVSGLMMLSRLPRDSFAKIAACTLLTQLTLQAALNVAVVTAMVPPKGISHPLISYGGSSLVISLVTLGIVLSLANDSDSRLAGD